MASDPPQDPKGSRAYESLAERVRHRSSQNNRLSSLCALEIVTLDGVQAAPEAMELISERVRHYIDQAIDASSRWQERETDRRQAELDLERKRGDAERKRADQERDARRKLILAVLRYQRGDLDVEILNALLRVRPT